jgi:coenzyme F420-dependent glucose-6-phosphate dehydrogenase
MSQKNGAVVGAEVVNRQGCFSANPDDHVAFLRTYGDLGFTHLSIHYAVTDQKGLLA